MSNPEYIYETFIRATPDEVWQALTSAEFTRQYFHGTHIYSDWQAGSPVVFRGDEGNALVEGEVIVAHKPVCLSYTWRTLYDEELAKEAPSRVTFDIEAMEGVCRLRITHDKFKPGSKTYERVSQGWSAIICSLKSLLETSQPLPIAGNETPEDQKGAA
ncbi:MAG: SRPBCC family protein [Gammaproteobacteria bacterium]